MTMHAFLQPVYLGLAPFLRHNIGGGDLRPLAQAFLEKAGEGETDPCFWMNMATAFFTLNQQQVGLSMQDQALETRRLYELSPVPAAPRLRLLVLAVRGDIAENTPIDCLLEGGQVALTYYFATPEQPLPMEIPAHDAVLVAPADSPANRILLGRLEEALADWEKPVINRPSAIPNTERGAASVLLQGIPGLYMPPTRRIGRDRLLAVAQGAVGLESAVGWGFPVILRPVGSQAGRDLARIEGAADIAAYLECVADAAFYISPFIDYSGADGLFRKYRIALVDGRAFACHMGISADWMIHYVNAGMYEDAAKRAEEAAFMAGFAQFAERHRVALETLCQRAGLDYFCIDCAETPAGELLIFEMDHVMVVHAMDPIDRFPYKQAAMRQVRLAFERLLAERAGLPALGEAA